MPTVGRPKPTPERAREIRRYRSSFEVMCGTVTEPAEVTPYTEGSSPHVSYVWDKDAGRYRWPRGTIRDGKNVSWHFRLAPDDPQEQRRYREYLDRKKKVTLQKKQGNRLKIR